MPRPPLGERAMTAAQRQARYRAARAANAPVIRTRRPADHRSRAQRWHDAVATITALQAEYAIWLESLPPNLQEGATAQALQAIVEFDLFRNGQGVLTAPWASGMASGQALSTFVRLHEVTGQYYLHSFYPEQPDLNWRNPAVADAMDAFETGVNKQVLSLTTDWQTVEVDGDRVPNDHGDADYDAKILDRLGRTHEMGSKQASIL